eukprot:353272-Chlamydomonas_euryale.AAC.10
MCVRRGVRAWPPLSPPSPRYRFPCVTAASERSHSIREWRAGEAPAVGEEHARLRPFWDWTAGGPVEGARVKKRAGCELPRIASPARILMSAAAAHAASRA